MQCIYQRITIAWSQDVEDTKHEEQRHWFRSVRWHLKQVISHLFPLISFVHLFTMYNNCIYSTEYITHLKHSFPRLSPPLPLFIFHFFAGIDAFRAVIIGELVVQWWRGCIDHRFVVKCPIITFSQVSQPVCPPWILVMQTPQFPEYWFYIWLLWASLIVSNIEHQYIQCNRGI